jgi:hypothetical protein
MESFDMIFNNDKENDIHSGGFSIKSIMLKKGISPIKTLNYLNIDDADQQIGGSQVSDLFNSMVVPNWAYYAGKITNREISGGERGFEGGERGFEEEPDDDNVIDDDLHNKLLDLVKHDIPVQTNSDKTNHNKVGGKTKKNIGKKMANINEKKSSQKSNTKKNLTK